MKTNFAASRSSIPILHVVRINPRMLLLGLLPLLFAVSCASSSVVRLNKPTLETYGDGPADEQGVYSWRKGQHAATSRPAKAPTFSCCETQVRIRRIRRLGIANVLLGAGANRQSVLRAQFEVTLETRCMPQNVPAEEGEPDEEDSGGTTERPPLADCLLTLEEVSATAAPFTTFPGGLALGAPAERTWWTSKVEKCDGRRKTHTQSNQPGPTAHRDEHISRRSCAVLTVIHHGAD